MGGEFLASYRAIGSHHDRILHPDDWAGQKRRFDFGHINPIAADLHLLIHPP